MAPRAVRAEELLVAVLGRMAGRALEERLPRREPGRSRFLQIAGRALLQPGEQPIVFAVGTGPGELSELDPGQGVVVHVGGPPIPAPVLEVTLPAILDRGVERGWRATEQGFARRMTGDAVRGLGAPRGGVAGGAIRLEKGMPLRELPGARLTLPRDRLRPPRHASVGEKDVGQETERQDDPDPFLHVSNQRRPKWIPDQR